MAELGSAVFQPTLHLLLNQLYLPSLPIFLLCILFPQIFVFHIKTGSLNAEQLFICPCIPTSISESQISSQQEVEIYKMRWYKRNMGGPSRYLIWGLSEREENFPTPRIPVRISLIFPRSTLRNLFLFFVLVSKNEIDKKNPVLVSKN